MIDETTNQLTRMECMRPGLLWFVTSYSIKPFYYVIKKFVKGLKQSGQLDVRRQCWSCEDNP